ncbi:hypothetical protein GQ457_02G027340 [Hibiscus cannabinus]
MFDLAINTILDPKTLELPPTLEKKQGVATHPNSKVCAIFLVSGKDIFLPLELERIHDVFNVSMLQKYRLDPSHIIPYEKIEVRRELTSEEKLVAILDTEEKVLRNKSTTLVKVFWCHNKIEEAVWEPEVEMKHFYLYLFPSGKF